MKLYLDSCCYNRPYDDQTQEKIHMEGEALGPVGMVRFMQQYENGYGDYTNEKYQQPDLSVEEIDIVLRKGTCG